MENSRDVRAHRSHLWAGMRSLWGASKERVLLQCPSEGPASTDPLEVWDS